MPEQSSDDKWPSYIPAPRDDIFALGVISLNYGYLENMLRSLFTSVVGLTDAQASMVLRMRTSSHVARA